MFDSGFVLIIIFLGIVLWSRMKLTAQMQKRESAASPNKPQPLKPLPQQAKSEPVKTEQFWPVPSFEGRAGGVMTPLPVKATVQKSFTTKRSPMISGITDSTEGFDREWSQGIRDTRKQDRFGQETNKRAMPIFARDTLLQAFIVHEVLEKPKFRQGCRRV